MSKRVSREGSRVPNVELTELADGQVKKYSSRELFGGRKVILFALPGAFTPTCSTAHVPGYVAHLKAFRDAGVDDIVCLSVNDPFVMEAWQRSEKAQGIHFVADPYGDFTKEMGMSIDHRDAGLGTRSWRYSMLVNDGVIEIWDAANGHWGRCGTDADGFFSFLVAPGASQLEAYVFARGLLKQQLTRINLSDAEQENGAYRFDIRLQGDRQTVFFAV